MTITIQKSSHRDIQKINCVNSNINVNGIDITQIPEDGTATSRTANEAAEQKQQMHKMVMASIK